MAAQTGIYKDRVTSNYVGLYLLLGLKVDDSSGMPLYDFLLESKSRFRDYFADKSKAAENNLRLEASVAEISKISETCSFSYISLLDFSVYKRVDYLLSLILGYEDVNSVRRFMDEEIKELIEYMTLMEKDNGPLFKNTLSYMTIRNFLMLLVNKRFIHASVYASFLKEQIFLSEGLSPRLQYTDLYKGELGLEIKKNRSKFSNSVRRTLKNRVKTVLNKSYDDETVVAKDSDSPSITKKMKNMIVRGFNENGEKVEYDKKIVKVNFKSNGKEHKRKIKDDISSSIKSGDYAFSNEDENLPSKSEVFINGKDIIE